MAKEKKISVAAHAREIALPLIEEMGLILWDVQYVKEGSSWFLRFLIDRAEGLGIDACEKFSRAVEKLCDAEDFIENSYCLEVSSPGIERELKRPEHFEYSIGKLVRARLIRPRDGVKEIIGRLVAYRNKTAALRLEDGNDVELPVAETAFIRIYYDYNNDYEQENDGGID